MASADPSPVRSRAVHLKPALRAALFLLLGASVGVAATLGVTAGPADGPGGSASALSSAPPPPSGSPGPRTITVPNSCEQGMARAQAAMRTIGDAAEALGNLQSARLQQLLNQLQQDQAEVDRLAAECRRQAHAAN